MELEPYRRLAEHLAADIRAAEAEEAAVARRLRAVRARIDDLRRARIAAARLAGDGSDDGGATDPPRTTVAEAAEATLRGAGGPVPLAELGRRAADRLGGRCCKSSLIAAMGRRPDVFRRVGRGLYDLARRES